VKKYDLLNIIVIIALQKQITGLLSVNVFDTFTVAAATPSVPQGAALGVLESDQAWSGSFDSALMGASVASAGECGRLL
jgi:hypothetical protein